MSTEYPAHVFVALQSILSATELKSRIFCNPHHENSVSIDADGVSLSSLFTWYSLPSSPFHKENVILSSPICISIHAYPAQSKLPLLPSVSLVQILIVPKGSSSLYVLPCPQIELYKSSAEPPFSSMFSNCSISFGSKSSSSTSKDSLCCHSSMKYIQNKAF